MALSDDIRQLTAIPIFRHLDEEALRLLAFAAETKLLRPGDVLFREGDGTDGAYFVTRGGFELRAANDAGPMIVVPPVLLGETALITQTTRPCTATATEMSTVRLVTRALFHRVLDESPDGAVKIRAMLLRRLGAYASELARFAQDSGEG